MQGLRVFVCLTAVFLTPATVAAEEESRTAEEILRSYVEDFRQDPAAGESITFGIRITGEDGGDWHVTVAGKERGAQKAKVTLQSGFPANPAPYFKLDLDPLLHLVPVPIDQVLLESFQHPLRRADEVGTAALAEERQVGLADHPAVRHPNPLGLPVLGFHRLDDGPDGRGIGCVACKDFVPQGDTVNGQ
jgi:hypothetical protein